MFPSSPSPNTKEVNAQRRAEVQKGNQALETKLSKKIQTEARANMMYV